ncbi:hypothetical protein BHM03_00034280 [Ensete ventricosum]|nr:hypothetical protein BHM03_00034280 [Ensete ventricosum]
MLRDLCLMRYCAGHTSPTQGFDEQTNQHRFQGKSPCQKIDCVPPSTTRASPSELLALPKGFQSRASQSELSASPKVFQSRASPSELSDSPKGFQSRASPSELSVSPKGFQSRASPSELSASPKGFQSRTSPRKLLASPKGMQSRVSPSELFTSPKASYAKPDSCLITMLTPDRPIAEAAQSRVGMQITPLLQLRTRRTLPRAFAKPQGSLLPWGCGGRMIGIIMGPPPKPDDMARTDSSCWLQVPCKPIM